MGQPGDWQTADGRGMMSATCRGEAMLRTQIVETEPANPPLVVPPELLAKVERANRIMEFDLLRSLENFDVDVRWQFVRNSNGGVTANLDLTTSFDGRRMGITGYPLDSDSFVDDKHIRTALDRPTWNFMSLLSYVNKMDVKRGIEKLETSALAEDR
jgi:hypothetical protein